MEEGNARPPKPGQAEFEIEEYVSDFLVTNFIDTFGTDLYFRDLRWMVHDLLPKYTTNRHFSTQSLLVPKWFEVFSLDQALEEGNGNRFKFGSMFKYLLPGVSGSPPFLGVGDAAKALVRKTRKIAKREGFKGFTVEDLKMVENAVVSFSHS